MSTGLGSSSHRRVVRRERRTTVLGLLAITFVIALDLALGANTVLLQLTLVGPLVAAFGANPRQTALAALYALTASVGLGWAGDAPFSTEHVTAVLAVAVGGAFSYAIARLRHARERDAARLTVQYRVARVVTESHSLDEAGPQLLAAIAGPLGWELGHIWETADGKPLRLAGAWRRDGLQADQFEQATREMVVAPGSGLGLPGRVWESGRPAWIPDVADDENFPRRGAAAAAGLRGGLAFPALSGDRCIAVLELFARDVRAPDAEMLALTEALGTQIGDFINAQKAATAVLENEARKGAVLASSLDGVIMIDHAGLVVEFNPAAERIFGLPAAEAIGREMAALVVPPHLRRRHREAFTRYLETRKPVILGQRLELTGMRADGSEFPVELAVNRVGEREPPMFTGTVRDITERRRAEEEREEARDQLEAILRGVADAITAQAPDGRLLFANQAALDVLGFATREDLLSAPLSQILDRYDLYDEEGSPFPLENLPGRRALAGEDVAEQVLRFRVRATGEERWSAVKATPIRDSEGRVTMAINVIEDITAHKRAERAQRFLSEWSGVLGSSLDPSEVLPRVASLAVPELGDWCAVDLRDASGAPERVALVHTDPAMMQKAVELRERYPPDPYAATGVPHVMRTGRPELYSEVPEELLRRVAHDEEHHQLLKDIGMRSVMIVPMRARNRTVGALSFVTGPSGRRYDKLDLELAQELAGRCATAIDNAQLFADRAYIARTLQQSLLPAELPEIPGIEAAARFRPTGEGNEVGGDFYDLFETGQRGWTVVVGDVCGKGPDAAAVTALARYTLRAAAMRERLPSRCLQLLNEALLRQRDDRRFCTVVYAYLEPKAEGVRLALACGGHPLPLLLHRDGVVQQVGAPGTLLGVVADPSLEDRSLLLQRGDALVLYTDGVIEGRAANGALDEERLAELVAGCAGMGADAIAATVEDAAVSAQVGEPRDDIAVLVLRVAD